MIIPAHYTNDLTRRTGALQQLQVFMADEKATVTLADVKALVETLQQNYGATATLETIIQAQVASDLQDQVLKRLQKRGRSI